MKKDNRGGAARLAMAAILLVSMAGYVCALSRMFQTPLAYESQEDDFLFDEALAPRAVEQPVAATFHYSPGQTAPEWLMNVLPGYSSGSARELWYLSLDRSGDRRLSFETSGSVNDSSSPYQTFNVALFSNVSTFAGITGSKTVSPSAPVPPDPDPPEFYWRGDGVPGNWDTLSPNWGISGVGSTV